MTDNNHPITPPLELVHQWADMLASRSDQGVFSMAAQWGADQELEACLRLVEIDAGEDAYDFARYIRAARRPKPPSLKEQALLLLDEFSDPEGLYLDVKSHNTIRRALEQLDD
jgi:hypothetical protein